MRTVSKYAAIVAATVALTAGSATAAHADYRNADFIAGNAAVCQGQDGYTFLLTFNSGLAGAPRYFGYSEWNFGNLDISEPGTGGTPASAKFCNTGANGSGMGVKNHAASAWNGSASSAAAVYYNSGYGGLSDYVGIWNAVNLVNTKNENASFKWF